MPSEAWKSGACDAILERESACPYRWFKKESDYLKGYLHGTTLRQKTNVLPQPQTSIIIE